MIVSGHQPAYLPWLGYFHKLLLCDVFVFMDTVQYLENDWNNRNRIRTPDGWMWLTLPIDRKKTTGNGLHQIYLRGDEWRSNHWQSIHANYKRSTYFDLYWDELESFYLRPWDRLIDLCWEQLQFYMRALTIHTRIVRMSEVEFSGKKDELVLDHCLKLGGSKVVFGTHGKSYVDVSKFKKHNIDVYFQDYQHPVYPQRFSGFYPYMGILDLLFNCGPDSRQIIMGGNITYERLCNR